MSRLTRIVLAGCLVAGAATTSSTLLACAKQSEPAAAAPGSKFTVHLGDVTVTRRATGASREDDILTFHVRLTNGLAGDVVVDRVEYSFGIGERELGSTTLTPALTISSGDTSTIRLGGTWEWRQQSDLPEGQAWVRGTVYWTGPHQARTTTFELSGDYEETQ
ncbi:MAG: hypothetical protein D6798_20435 [Deltaproteobacteria bacterium]|nr:MAG: hypothetical protein D6798_20435 [Deltaproteobacteria bacterium]